MGEGYMGPVYNDAGKRVARYVPQGVQKPVVPAPPSEAEVPRPKPAQMKPRSADNPRSPLPHIRGYVHEDGRVLTRWRYAYIWEDQHGGVIAPSGVRPSELDSYFRGRGFRPVFTKRDFHARALAGGGFVLECRRCDTREEFTNPEKAHDLASFHAKWWHSGEIRIPSYKEVQAMAREHEERVREAREAEES